MSHVPGVHAPSARARTHVVASLPPCCRCSVFCSLRTRIRRSMTSSRRSWIATSLSTTCSAWVRSCCARDCVVTYRDAIVAPEYPHTPPCHLLIRSSRGGRTRARDVERLLEVGARQQRPDAARRAARRGARDLCCANPVPCERTPPLHPAPHTTACRPVAIRTLAIHTSAAHNRLTGSARHSAFLVTWATQQRRRSTFGCTTCNRASRSFGRGSRCQSLRRWKACLKRLQQRTLAAPAAAAATLQHLLAHASPTVLLPLLPLHPWTHPQRLRTRFHFQSTLLQRLADWRASSTASECKIPALCMHCPVAASTIN